MPHHTTQAHAHGHAHAAEAGHGHDHAPQMQMQAQMRNQFIHQWRIARTLAFVLFGTLLAGGVYLAGWAAQTTLGTIAGGVLALLGFAGLAFMLSRGLIMHLMTASHGHDHAAQQVTNEGHTLHRPKAYDMSLQYGLSMALGGERRFRKGILKLANLKPGDKMLDVGSGPGTAVILAAGQGIQATGIDASPEMVAYAREKAVTSGVTVNFHEMSAGEMTFADNTFDVVTNTFVMHHLPGDLKERGLAEMYRVLKPGGLLLVIEFEPPKSTLGKLLMSIMLGPQMMHIVTADLTPMLKQAGFTHIETGRAGTPLATFVSARKAS